MTTSEKPAEKANVPVRAGAQRGESRLARWDPMEMIDSLQDEMSRLWGQSWPFRAGLRPMAIRRPIAMTAAAPWAPRMDVYEKDGALMIKAELPGVNREDIQVTLEQGDLMIKGERKEESEVKEEDYYSCERSYGSFFRRLPVPFEIQPEQVEASFKDGILEVRLPKPAEEKAASKQIPIK
jgi:HSP20 family protein